MDAKKNAAGPTGKPFFRFDPAATIALAFAAFLLSQLLAAIVISFYPAMRDWTEAEATAWLRNSVSGQFVFNLTAYSILIGMVLRLIRKANVTPARIGLVAPKVRDVGYGLMAYGLYFLIYIAVLSAVRTFVPGLDIDQEQQIGFEAAYSGGALLMAFMSLVILPPLAEEILFRGFLFTSLRARFNLVHATIITSVLFGAAHLQFGADTPLLWVAAIDTFVLSCVMCYVREKLGSLWPAIFLHAVKNLIAFIVLFGSRFWLA